MGDEEWKGKYVSRRNLEGQYVRANGTFMLLYFLASDIHNKPFPYERTAQSMEDADKIEKNVQTIGRFPYNSKRNRNGKKLSLEGVTQLNHAPVRLNYWHAMLGQYPADSANPIVTGNGAWRRSMINSVIETYIIHAMQLEMSENRPVPSEIYERRCVDLFLAFSKNIWSWLREQMKR